jgi:hypothetical protein
MLLRPCGRLVLHCWPLGWPHPWALLLRAAWNLLEQADPHHVQSCHGGVSFGVREVLQCRQQSSARQTVRSFSCAPRKRVIRRNSAPPSSQSSPPLCPRRDRGADECARPAHSTRTRHTATGQKVPPWKISLRSWAVCAVEPRSNQRLRAHPQQRHRSPSTHLERHLGLGAPARCGPSRAAGAMHSAPSTSSTLSGAGLERMRGHSQQSLRHLERGRWRPAAPPAVGAAGGCSVCAGRGRRPAAGGSPAHLGRQLLHTLCR